METLTDIITKLIKADTNALITLTAEAILARPDYIMASDLRSQAFGIILLAVDDAKTSDRPASAATLYREVFALTKELMGGAECSRP